MFCNEKLQTSLKKFCEVWVNKRTMENSESGDDMQHAFLTVKADYMVPDDLDGMRYEL